MKVNFWLGMGGLLFLSGCGAGWTYTTNYTPYDLKEPALAAKNPSDVLIISDITKINKPYKEIGVIQIEDDWSSGTLMETLRKEAAKRGADAVINIQETSSNKTGWTNYGNVGSGWVGGTPGTLVGGTSIGGTPGYYNAGTPLILSDDKTTFKIRGTAIIFTEVSK